MTQYVIRGGNPLNGEVVLSGAKNAAVAILPAALLVEGVCRIENIPDISLKGACTEPTSCITAANTPTVIMPICILYAHQATEK